MAFFMSELFIYARDPDIFYVGGRVFPYGEPSFIDRDIRAAIQK